MAETTTKKAPKGTVKTEVIIGEQAKNLTKATTIIASVVESVKSLGEDVEKYQAIIAQKEDEIKDLDIQFNEKKRQSQIQLELDIKSFGRTAVDEILTAQGLRSVEVESWEKLNKELVDLKANSASEVSKAVNAATSAMKKDHEHEMAMMKADFDKREATNTADLKAANDKVAGLEKQVEDWKSALEAERNAGTERAKANAIGTLNLGSGKN